MTTIKCPWVVCKYNTGTVLTSTPGICLADGIELGNVSISEDIIAENNLEIDGHEDIEISDCVLNCMTFKYAREKV